MSFRKGKPRRQVKLSLLSDKILLSPPGWWQTLPTTEIAFWTRNFGVCLIVILRCRSASKFQHIICGCETMGPTLPRRRLRSSSFSGRFLPWCSFHRTARTRFYGPSRQMGFIRRSPPTPPSLPGALELSRRHMFGARGLHMAADSLSGLSLGIVVGRRTVLNVGDCHIPQLARSVIRNRRQFSTSYLGVW
jgi:hypothetical protein